MTTMTDGNADRGHGSGMSSAARPQPEQQHHQQPRARSLSKGPATRQQQAAATATATTQHSGGVVVRPARSLSRGPAPQRAQSARHLPSAASRERQQRRAASRSRDASRTRSLAAPATNNAMQQAPSSSSQGGYASDGGTRQNNPYQREHQMERRQQLVNGGTGGGSSNPGYASDGSNQRMRQRYQMWPEPSSSQSAPSARYRRRRTQDGTTAGGAPRHQAAGGLRRASYGGSQPDVATDRTFGGLRPLPEDASLRCSNNMASMINAVVLGGHGGGGGDDVRVNQARPAAASLNNGRTTTNNPHPKRDPDRTAPDALKDLNDMTFAELRDELASHGVVVSGEYEKSDLRSICAIMKRGSKGGQGGQQQQQRQGAGGSVADGESSGLGDGVSMTSVARSALADITSYPRDRPSSSRSVNNSSSHASSPAGNSGRRSLGSRNPSNNSVAMNSISRRYLPVRSSSGERRDSHNDEGVGQLGASNHSNLQQGQAVDVINDNVSSIGDPDVFTDDEDGRADDGTSVVVMNAPLGMGLSGIAAGNKKNEQMGRLLHQMMQLEEQAGGNRRDFTGGPRSVRSLRSVGPESVMTNGSNNNGPVSVKSVPTMNGGVVGFAASRRATGASRASSRGHSTVPGEPLSRSSSHSSFAEMCEQLDWVTKGGQDSTEDVTIRSGMDSKKTAQSDHSKKTKAGFLFSKKCVCITVASLLVVGGVVAGALMLFVFDIGGDSGGDSPSSTIAQLPTAPTISPESSMLKYPPLPPNDIEGRCSPSNLPGSLSACVVACLPSACCYENSCVNGGDVRSVEACNRYRPYCNVIYEPWPGAAQGELRPPPQGVVALCAVDSREGGPADGADDSEGGTSAEKPTEVQTSDNASEMLPASYFGRKRTRHHPTPRVLRGGLKEKSGSQPRRSLWVPAPSEICEQYCVSARCCHAPAHVEGTVISENGVHTNEVTGEYVVTSCPQNLGTDSELCSEYDKFCTSSHYSNDSYYTTTDNSGVESVHPTNAKDSMRTSPTVSPPPSVRPTTNVFTMALTTQSTVTSPPTEAMSDTSHVIPASTFEIAAACNVAMIVSESASARASCLDACQNGLCCYSEMLGFGSWLPSCYEGNAAACLEYSPCLVLVKNNDALSLNDNDNTPNNPNVHNGTVTISESITDEHSRPQENATLVNGTAADEAPQLQVQPLATLQNATTDVDMAIFDGPPIPSHNLTQLCSQESLLTFEGLSKCLGACEAGSCCTGDPSCQPEHAEICQIYQPCTDILPKVNDDTVQDGLASPPEVDNSTLREEDIFPEVNNATVQNGLASLAEDYVSEVTDDAILPPAAPSNLTNICSLASMAEFGGAECFETCQLGQCCSGRTCLDEHTNVSQSTLEKMNDICDEYQTCELYTETISMSRAINANKVWLGVCSSGNNLILVSVPPVSHLDDICDPNSSTTTDDCAAICSAVSCCFVEPSSRNDPNTSSTSVSQSCYVLFEDICDVYAQYCNPSTEPQIVSAATITIPPAPSDLTEKCDFSSEYCNEACKDASCCFESSSEYNCFSDNAERCMGYFPCIDRV